MEVVIETNSGWQIRRIRSSKLYFDTSWFPPYAHASLMTLFVAVLSDVIAP